MDIFEDMFDGPNDFDPAFERELPIEEDAGIVDESEGWFDDDVL
jgi:hypothetical protein